MLQHPPPWHIDAAGGRPPHRLLINGLATVLASEEVCELAYDQEAISEWVSRNVAADDLAFASQLEGQVLVGQSILATHTASQRTAHCAAVTNSARHYGFVR